MEFLVRGIFEEKLADYQGETEHHRVEIQPEGERGIVEDAWLDHCVLEHDVSDDEDYEEVFQCELLIEF